MNSYIAYQRVSTARQGKSGLGLEAQEAAIEGFIKSNGGTVIERLQEVESGARADRPELAKAIKLCRVYGATLLVAKLDRLSRDVHFLTGLQKAGIKFKCCDNPHADELTIHILIAMAQHERNMISARTKAAFAAAKARGKKFGGVQKNHHYPDKEMWKRSAQAVSEAADRFANDIRDILEFLHEEGFTTALAKAAELNRRGVPTPRKGRWFAETVIRIQDRLCPRCPV